MSFWQIYRKIVNAIFSHFLGSRMKKPTSRPTLKGKDGGESRTLDKKRGKTEGKKSNYFCSCEGGREGNDEVTDVKERRRKRRGE